ncbi:hypothetical protein JAAARDRAFT_36509 [Jaapia argillacea MUCL 33604]|uniref:ABC transporter domain-containing protein n=1 Tax=Jaapia argillacea MUCL 33604 TaxID=933084 RepID=A0A067Q168_9AGAM|nr:hypothetical protein JAAARDRAFT_36509 [Jaapia argillacea MUCL 33604]
MSYILRRSSRTTSFVRGQESLTLVLRAGLRTKSDSAPLPILDIPKSNIYRFGDAKNPVFHDIEWTIQDGESWAVVGSGSGEKTTLLETLIGNLRITPPPPHGLFPFSTKDPHNTVSLVSFSHRPRASGSSFVDYTARYGAKWEEDRITLRQSMFPETLPEFARRDNRHGSVKEMSEEEKASFEALAKDLDLERFLDLPVIALSNGQTRKARILKALLRKPEMLVLDEPLTGVDAATRPILLSLLHSLHASKNPRMILGLRNQDPIPDWISHLVVLKGGGRAISGRRGDVEGSLGAGGHSHGHGISHEGLDAKERPEENVGSGGTEKDKERRVVVEMRNVNVKYDDRHVLKDINWSIREGDRWHLQGPNGSGKTTLLSLLTGDHPQSYTQTPPQSHLHLFSLPRRKLATAVIATRVGVVSPEIYNAFPRRKGMSVWEAVGTGFDGGFVPRGVKGVGLGLSGGLREEEEVWRVGRVREVVRALGPSAWSQLANSRHHTQEELGALDHSFSQRPFADLSPGEQSVVLLMRALVGKPPLVILDEVWSGMDDLMVESSRSYLRRGGVGEEQAVLVVSHWEEEVPWGVEDGVKRMKLEGGKGFES